MSKKAKGKQKTEQVRWGWVEGARFSGNANLVGREIKRIITSINVDDEDAQAEAVVKAAKAKASPLHRLIYKESTAAAAWQYRLELARKLIRSITIVYTGGGGGRETITRAFVHLRGTSVAEGGGYRPIEQVMKTTSLREHFIEQALAEAESYCARYNHILDLLPVVEAIAGVRHKLSLEVAGTERAVS